MASGRSANSRITPLVKVASVKGVLALATGAVLFLSGCGGNSDSDTSTEETQPHSAAVVGGGSGSDADAQGSAGQASGYDSVQSGGTQPSLEVGKEGPSVPVRGGPQEPGVTPKQRQEATVASISLSSPAIEPATLGSPSALPPTYTCDGRDTWPELRWEGAPPNTKELALFVMGLQPGGGKVFFDWTVAGLSPELRGIKADRLPKGAVVGRNSFGRVGYSICPPPGQQETYFFALYALSEPSGAKKGFDPYALREQALRSSSNRGLMAASYARQ